MPFIHKNRREVEKNVTKVAAKLTLSSSSSAEGADIHPHSFG